MNNLFKTVNSLSIGVSLSHGPTLIMFSTDIFCFRQPKITEHMQGNFICGSTFSAFMPEPESEDQGNKGKVTGFDRIIDQFEKYTKTSSIITVSNDSGDYEEWDAARNGDEIVYGTESRQNELFKQHLLDFILGSEIVSIVLRSFTDVKDRKTKWPFKELRGYYVTHETHNGGKKIMINQLTAEEMFTACNTDHRTGKSLKPEDSVIYCDNERCIDSDQKPVMIIGFRDLNENSD